MNDRLNRRELIRAGAAASLAAALPRGAFGEAPAVLAPKSVKPVVISAANGNVARNGGDVTCVQKAFTLMTQGSDVLDALIAGVNIVELDPEDDSVGYGGLPNAEGVVQLDSFEALRRGAHPKDAGMEALRRVVANTVEKTLLNDRRQPNFGLNFYVLNARGEHAGVSMYPAKYAVCTEIGRQTLPTEALFGGEP